MRIDAAFAADLAAEALRSGADEAEVSAALRSRLSVEVKDRTVDALSVSATSGYGLRVVSDVDISG